MPAREAQRARLFAALGDETRLNLLTRLSRGRPRSIAELTGGTPLTRQAVTKHLRVLQRARLIHSTRRGRESLFQLDPAPLHQAQDFLAHVSAQWDNTLTRLKAYVEQ